MSNKHFSKITSKGQVTIPIRIRKNLNILTNSRIQFIEQNNNIIITPINKNLSDLKHSLPKPKKALSIEEIEMI